MPEETIPEATPREEGDVLKNQLNGHSEKDLPDVPTGKVDVQDPEANGHDNGQAFEDVNMEEPVVHKEEEEEAISNENTAVVDEEPKLTLSAQPESELPSIQIEIPQEAEEEAEEESAEEPVTESAAEGAVVRSAPKNSHFLTSSFTSLLESKELKKHAQVKTSVQNVLDSLNNPTSSNGNLSHLIFDTLKMTCELSSNSLKVKSVDIFAKVFDYGIFEDEPDVVQLTDASVDVIASCFDGEGTDPLVETQVLRALTNSILIMPCHGAALLKAVRQIYNIFIFSLSSDNQLIAQGTLNQVINSIFGRINEKTIRTARSNSVKEDDYPSIPQTPTTSNSTPLTLEKLNNTSHDDDKIIEANMASVTDEDLVIKDAFLIFRAMCKLSVKPLELESLDMRSHSVRSKLLSLHIIHTILKDHIDIFLSHNVVILSSNTPLSPQSGSGNVRLINAVRQYLCLSLSRNAASPIAPVFELSLEIFWLIISNLRSDFKREIPVFWDEIYLPVAEMKTSTSHQKRYLLSTIEKLCNDSRCIIEFYLNYDCDSSMPNICEKIIDYLSKLSFIRIEVTPQQKLAYREYKKHGISVYDISKTTNLASGKMSSKPPEPEIYNHFPVEYALKMEAIGCTVDFLKSLYSWAQKANNSNNTLHQNNSSSNNLLRAASGSHISLRERSGTVDSASGLTSSSTPSKIGSFSPTDPDDPEQFENLKQRKKAFLEGVRQFNQKPKKGIKFFIENGFINDDEPVTISSFLHETDALDKAALGEYLGEGNDSNIAIMHAFVDEMEFQSLPFVEAMRRFLQSFRLPGEAQKIDRFMLKFAERYLLGNPDIFSNADAAYILAYSVILLNTDQHSPQVKNRMTFDAFVMNNAGIDDGKDLPKDFLREIYDEIQSNEIKLQSEQHTALLNGDINGNSSNTSTGFFGGRDLNREAYIHASKEMATKTEKLVRNLGKKGGRYVGAASLLANGSGEFTLDDSNGSHFFVASHVYHVKSIFDTLWMSILAGLTPPFKEYDDEDTCQLCLEGIKLSIRIACMFELDYARTSYIRALVQFGNLNNYEEMKPKNVEAIHIMLDLAVTEGNHLQSSWIQILTSISQLERLQLIAQGVDQYSIPDVSIAKLTNRTSVESGAGRNSTSFFRSFTAAAPSASQTASNKFHNQTLTEQVAKLLTQTDLEVAMDKVFTNSANLSRDSILEFVKALSQVSSEEIESSGSSANPRMFSLQKFVDVCYYNMSRIRVEWSQLWSIMGETFNDIGCRTSNLVIAFFALDSLRQLSMRFMEIEELSHFKFQKEFLKPFEYIMIHNSSLEVKDMVLECINNMILAKASSIKSGWKTIFKVLTAAGILNKELLVQNSFKMGNWINKEYLEVVTQQESFGDLVICFTELAKNERFQKISLLSLEVLLKIMTNEGRKYVSDENKDSDVKIPVPSEVLFKIWYPILFGFYDIIMTGEELEVRSRALNHLFKIIMEYGSHFEIEFWKEIHFKLLFPIFSVLSNHWELSNLDNDDDKLSVWLSTTLIQALRNMITLFTHYYDPLSVLLENYLTLLISCICQENDTIARIGRSCLHSLLIDNCEKFGDDEWNKITRAVTNLFELTTATELFSLDPEREQDIGAVEDEDTDVEITDAIQGDGSFNATMTTTEERLKKSKEKSSIVVKCVLQLLMIETLLELFENDELYEAVPHKFAIQMSKLLEDSYEFSKKFNEDYDLRVRLWNAGVIERLPNLLKQESSSSAVFLNIMFRMYCDDDKTTSKEKKDIINKIIPLCENITTRFTEFDEASQQRNISTWKPVIVEIFQGYVELDDDDFIKFSPNMYKVSIKLLGKTLTLDLRLAIKTFLSRVGDAFVFEKKEKK